MPGSLNDDANRREKSLGGSLGRAGTDRVRIWPRCTASGFGAQLPPEPNPRGTLILDLTNDLNPRYSETRRLGGLIFIACHKLVSK